MTANLDNGRNLVINLTFGPDNPTPSKYALATTAKLKARYSDTSPRITSVVIALNPSHPAAVYDSSYGRLLPISNWMLPINNENDTRESLTYTVNSRQLVKYMERAVKRELTLEVRLQFVESLDGGLANPEQSRDAFTSRQSQSLQL